MAAPRKRNSENISVPELVDSPRGRGKLLTGGMPGNKGGTGRPPNEFREHLRALVNRDKVQEYLAKCIEGEFGPKFHLQAVQYASDRAYGRPNQSVDVYEFDPQDFTEAGLERVAAGEDPVHVLTTGGRANRNA